MNLFYAHAVALRDHLIRTLVNVPGKILSLNRLPRPLVLDGFQLHFQALANSIVEMSRLLTLSSTIC